MSARTLLRFLTSTFDRFLGLFGHSLSGLLGFLSDRFCGLLGLLPYGFDSFLNFLACFLCPLLYVLGRPFLPKRASAPAATKVRTRLVIFIGFLLSIWI